MNYTTRWKQSYKQQPELYYCTTDRMQSKTNSIPLIQYTATNKSLYCTTVQLTESSAACGSNVNHVTVLLTDGRQTTQSHKLSWLNAYSRGQMCRITYTVSDKIKNKNWSMLSVFWILVQKHAIGVIHGSSLYDPHVTWWLLLTTETYSQRGSCNIRRWFPLSKISLIASSHHL